MTGCSGPRCRQRRNRAACRPRCRGRVLLVRLARVVRVHRVGVLRGVLGLTTHAGGSRLLRSRRRSGGDRRLGRRVLDVALAARLLVRRLRVAALLDGGNRGRNVRGVGRVLATDTRLLLLLGFVSGVRVLLGLVVAGRRALLSSLAGLLVAVKHVDPRGVLRDRAGGGTSPWSIGAGVSATGASVSDCSIGAGVSATGASVSDCSIGAGVSAGASVAGASVVCSTGDGVATGAVVTVGVDGGSAWQGSRSLGQA